MDGWGWLWFVLWSVPVYIYFLYPFYCRVLGNGENKISDQIEEPWPSLLVLCVYHNEVKSLPQKLKNTMKLNYPEANLDICFVSDASDDGSDEFLRENKRIRLRCYDIRQGKSQALDKALREEMKQAASGTVVLLTDANTQIDPDAPRFLISALADPEIKFACGRLRLLAKADSSLGEWEQRYWENEQVIKRGESSRGMLVGANGGLYAFRLQDYPGIDQQGLLMEDLYIPLLLIESGGKGIFVEHAGGEEIVTGSDRNEFLRKLRIATANFTMLPALLRLHLPGRMWVALCSHKILRWFFPVFWPFLFIATVWQWPFAYGRAILIAHILLLLLAVIGRWVKMFSGYYYGILMNVALFAGFWRACFGRPAAHWESFRS